MSWTRENFGAEIYNRENMSYEESNRIRRVAGKYRHKSFEQNRAEFLEKEKLSKEMLEISERNQQVLERQKKQR